MIGTNTLWHRRWLTCLWLCWVLCVWPVAAAAQFGITVRDANLPGAEITAVAPGTPAEFAALRPGDVIVGAQGAAIRSADDFTRLSRKVVQGAVVTLRVSRQGWEKEVRLQPAIVRDFGLTTKVSAAGNGAEIATILGGGAAARAGLEPGDRVTHFDAAPVESAAALDTMLREAAAMGRSVSVIVERGGWAKEMTLSALPPAASDAATEAPAARAPESVSTLATPGMARSDLDEGNRLYDTGAWREAEAAYSRVLRQRPEDPRVVGRLCHVQVMLERFAEAVETCQRAAVLAPGEASTLQNIGYALARLGRHADAIGWYQKAIVIAPDWLPPYAGIASAQFTLRNWGKAEEYYRIVVTREPGNAAAWQALGDVAAEQGNSLDAVTAYRRALELGRSTAALHRALGWQLYQSGRDSDALPALREASRLDPADAGTLVSVGIVAARLGQTAEARNAWQRAIEVDAAGLSGRIARQNLAALDASERPESGPPMAASPERQRASPESIPPGVAPSTREAPLNAPGAPLPSPSGLKVAVAIGDFQVKAANASQYMGDGLREMLLTALHGNGNFIVLERMDIKGLAAEQALSRSRMARAGEAVPEGRMDVADIMVYGAVTEFVPEAKGGGLSLGFGNLPLSLGVQSKTAHMAIDMRVVDVATGRVLATGRVTGEARSAQTTLGANISVHGTQFPATLGSFKNTPMEQAIRECIERATRYVIASTPQEYFRHR